MKVLRIELEGSPVWMALLLISGFCLQWSGVPGIVIVTVAAVLSLYPLGSKGVQALIAYILEKRGTRKRQEIRATLSNLQKADLIHESDVEDLTQQCMENPEHLVEMLRALDSSSPTAPVAEEA